MLPLLLLAASLVTDVRGLIGQQNLAGAERLARNYQARLGNSSELAAAISWLGRGALQNGDLARAEAFAGESRKLALDLQRRRGWDADLVTALGASIEVHAQVLASRGERSEAVSYLRAQLASFRATPIGERIQKNINLLSLEGKPAPPLDVTDSIGPKAPTLASLRGHPVLLFFWAHWCPDCKAMAPIVASLAEKFGPRGLRILRPTRLYGYVAGGEEAPPSLEKVYIEKVLQQYYPGLTGMPIPVSAANFAAYGASTTPTIVLVDSAGIVRLYHPGAISGPELAGHVQKLVSK